MTNASALLAVTFPAIDEVATPNFPIDDSNDAVAACNDPVAIANLITFSSIEDVFCPIKTIEPANEDVFAPIEVTEFSNEAVLALIDAVSAPNASN